MHPLDGQILPKDEQVGKLSVWTRKPVKNQAKSCDTYRYLSRAVLLFLFSAYPLWAGT